MLVFAKKVVTKPAKIKKEGKEYKIEETETFSYFTSGFKLRDALKAKLGWVSGDKVNVQVSADEAGNPDYQTIYIHKSTQDIGATLDNKKGKNFISKPLSSALLVYADNFLKELSGREVNAEEAKNFSFSEGQTLESSELVFGVGEGIEGEDVNKNGEFVEGTETVYYPVFLSKIQPKKVKSKSEAKKEAAEETTESKPAIKAKKAPKETTVVYDEVDNS